MNVLVLNSGSSSLKFQVIATDLERIRRDADERLCKGYVERIGGEAIITVEARNRPPREETGPGRQISPTRASLPRWVALGQPRGGGSAVVQRGQMAGARGGQH